MATPVIFSEWSMKTNFDVAFRAVIRLCALNGDDTQLPWADHSVYASHYNYS